MPSANSGTSKNVTNLRGFEGRTWLRCFTLDKRNVRSIPRNLEENDTRLVCFRKRKDHIIPMSSYYKLPLWYWYNHRGKKNPRNSEMNRGTVLQFLPTLSIDSIPSSCHIGNRPWQPRLPRIADRENPWGLHHFATKTVYTTGRTQKSGISLENRDLCAVHLGAGHMKLLHFCGKSRNLCRFFVSSSWLLTSVGDPWLGPCPKKSGTCADSQPWHPTVVTPWPVVKIQWFRTYKSAVDGGCWCQLG